MTSDGSPSLPGWSLRWSDAGIGVAVAAFGAWEASVRASSAGRDVSGSALVIALLMAVAAALYRAAPATALALVWAACAFQVLQSQDVALVQLAAAIVSFGAARYGRALTVWVSGLSIPVGSALALLYVRANGTSSLAVLTDAVAPPGGRISMTSAFLLPLSVLSLPWALGLVLRLTARLRRTREEREQAEIEAARSLEIAEVRAEQARLARDVHDVVGHSLTVILAQADSADYMDDQDIDRIRAALRNISTSARRSLGDVRQVLSSTNEASPDGMGGAVTPLATGGLDSLVDGVRSAGNDVRSRVVGTPRPMPPELDVVAFRVLQEMLTNALKHGRRGEPIDVERCFNADTLRIEVHNAAAGDDPSGSDLDVGEGIGLPGMRRRLEAVGGRLAVGRDEAPEGPVFTSTAWVPLRPHGGTP